MVKNIYDFFGKMGLIIRPQIEKDYTLKDEFFDSFFEMENRNIMLYNLL
jgi:hypothetical protein